MMEFAFGPVIQGIALFIGSAGFLLSAVIAIIRSLERRSLGDSEKPQLRHAASPLPQVLIQDRKQAVTPGITSILRSEDSSAISTLSSSTHSSSRHTAEPLCQPPSSSRAQRTVQAASSPTRITHSQEQIITSAAPPTPSSTEDASIRDASSHPNRQPKRSKSAFALARRCTTAHSNSSNPDSHLDSPSPRSSSSSDKTPAPMIQRTSSPQPMRSSSPLPLEQPATEQPISSAPSPPQAHPRKLRKYLSFHRNRDASESSSQASSSPSNASAEASSSSPGKNPFRTLRKSKSDIRGCHRGRSEAPPPPLPYPPILMTMTDKPSAVRNPSATIGTGTGSGSVTFSTPSPSPQHRHQSQPEQQNITSHLSQQPQPSPPPPLPTKKKSTPQPRTNPYEAPYFFPTPASRPVAVDAAEHVRPSLRTRTSTSPGPSTTQQPRRQREKEGTPPVPALPAVMK